MRTWTFVGAFVVALTLAASANADEAMIKYRQSVMKAVGGHMGAMALIVKQQVPFTGQLDDHAEAMADLAEMTGVIFPQGSGPEAGKTEALPDVWTKPADFEKAVLAFQQAAKALDEVADSGDRGTIAAALGGLAKTCKGCHDTFREKHSH